MKLLHIIPSLGPGGAARSLVTLVKELNRARPDVHHRVILLEDSTYIPLLFDLKRSGAEVVRTPSPERIAAEVDAADVVLVHFWNTPSLWSAIARGLPPARYVTWLHVRGSHLPQLVNRMLLSGSSRIIATAPLPPPLDAEFPDTPVVPGLLEPERLKGFTPLPHPGFNADYIGTTNSGKIHPRYVAMMARVEIPELKVRYCGGNLEPAMLEEIRRSPIPERFECLGFVEDVAAILSTSDVFAYPLVEDTYATSDKSLQEAMFAGIPPVIFPHGGPASMVQDGHSGLVARSEDEFVAAVEYLHRNPAQRRRLGANAQAYAATAFLPAAHALKAAQVMDAALQAQVRPLFPAVPDATAALLFLLSQDWDEADARAALADWKEGRSDRLVRFAADLPEAAFQVEGGILHWRREAMDDPLIRSWGEIWLQRKHRHEDASAEATEARRLGAPAARIGVA